MPEDKTPAAAESFDLAAAIAERKEQHPPLVITMPDGQEPVLVMPPTLWPNEALRLFNESDVLGAVAVVLGDDAERFEAAGGNVLILLDLLTKKYGSSLGELLAS